MDSNFGKLMKQLPDVYRYVPVSTFAKNLKKFLGGGFTKQTDIVDLFDVVESAIETDAGVQGVIDTYVGGADLAMTGTVSFAGTTSISEDLAFTETVTAPATSSTMTLVQKQLVHTVAGGATEVVPINVPDNALIVSAEILVSTILAFTTGVSASATWTNSTQAIGASGALAAKNTKVTSFYNANAESAIATGTPETITLTPNAGTIDSGVVVVVVRYWTLSGLANVA